MKDGFQIRHKIQNYQASNLNFGLQFAYVKCQMDEYTDSNKKAKSSRKVKICIQHLVVKRMDPASCSSSETLKRSWSPWLKLFSVYLSDFNEEMARYIVEFFWRNIFKGPGFVLWTGTSASTRSGRFLFSLLYLRSCFVQYSLKYRRLGGCLLGTFSFQTGQNLAKIRHFLSKK